MKASIVMTLCLSAVSLYALPQNPQVIEGHAQFVSQDRGLTVTAGDRSIIHWDSFSIASEEKTHFSLPQSTSLVLNRVTGGELSQIYGQLTSNGGIYLINPQGILIGKEGLIQVGNFLASTLDLANEEFLDGKKLHFSGDSKQGIENQGTIEAQTGDIVFLSRGIDNSGALLASQGLIVMGAGEEMIYLPHGDERIQICLKPAIKTGDEPVGILQTGRLEALSAELSADGNLYSYAIKNDGYVKATGLEGQEGHICFVAEDGVTRHSGDLIAEVVHLLGQQVHVVAQAKIDVSQPDGGGVILIGGDYQGKNPAILNANTTFVEKDVVLTADALDNGDGGKIIMWADGFTGCYGKMNVRGGPNGGDGGFVEASGKMDLGYSGLVDATAPLGKTGMLLLDPTNITISAAATSNLTPTVCPGPYTVITTPGVAANVNNTQLVTNLGTCSVTIFTSATAGGAQAGTLTVSAPVAWVSDNSLSLISNSTMTISSSITNTSTSASLTLMSGTTATSTMTIASGVTVGLTSSGTLTLDSSSVATSDMTILGTVNAIGSNLTILVADDFTLTLSAGNSLNFDSPGQTFTYTTTSPTNSISTFGAPVTIDGIANWTAVGTLNINDSLTIDGTNNTTINATGAITKSAGTSITHNSSGTFNMANTAAAATTLNGPFVNSATGGDVTISGGTALAINANFSNNSTTANATLSSGNFAAGTLTIAAAATVSHTSSGLMTLNAVATGSDIALIGALDVTAGNLTITLDDDFTSTATTGTLNFDSPGNTFTYATTGGTTSTSAFNGPVTIDGISNWTSAGAISFNDGLTVSGTGAMTLTSVGTITAGAASMVNYNSTGALDWSATGAASDITVSGVFNITSANATFTPNDDFTLTATTGVMTYSFAGGLLTLGAGLTTNQNISGTLSVTNGNLMITANDDIVITGTTGSITYNVPGGLCTFTSLGGADPDLTINGTLTIANGTLMANVFDDITIGAAGTFNFNSPDTGTLTASGPTGDIVMNGDVVVTNGAISMNASQNITSGGASTLTWSSPGHWSLTAVVDIAIGNGMTVSNGSLGMLAGDDISLAGTTDWSSTGTLSMMNTIPLTTSTIAINGLVNFMNGSWSIDSQGDITTAVASTINYSAPSPLPMLSHLGDITFNGLFNLNTPALFSAIASVGSISILNIVSNVSMGPITVDAGIDINVGDPNAIIRSQIFSAGGLLQMHAGHQMKVRTSDIPLAAAIIGASFGGTTGDISIDVGQSLLLLSEANSDAGIRSSRKITMTIGTDLLMRQENILGNTGIAFIGANDDLTITAGNDMTFLGRAIGPELAVFTTNGNLLLIANDSITAFENAHISNQGLGNLTIVVDQQAPLPPAVGLGKLNFFAGTSISNVSTAGGLLRLFTATPSQNQIIGLINGATFAEGVQIFGVYYSTYTGPSFNPFTIFYKTGGPPPPPDTAAAFATVVFDNAEMTQQVFDRTLGWAWSCPYTVCYDQSKKMADWSSFALGCSEHHLYHRKPFEYPIFLPCCCYQKDFVK